VNATAATMRVEAFGYAQLYATSAARRDVMIELTDGTLLFRRITGATENDDGTETITLDAQFGRSFTTAEVERVSFLNYRRLDQDEITVAWITDEAAQAAFRLRDLVASP
jgi:hypothetical protein